MRGGGGGGARAVCGEMTTSRCLCFEGAASARARSGGGGCERHVNVVLHRRTSASLRATTRRRPCGSRGRPRNLRPRSGCTR
jgi:hypothetical protein